jgi:hypothetical protein
VKPAVGSDRLAGDSSIAATLGPRRSIRPCSTLSESDAKRFSEDLIESLRAGALETGMGCKAPRFREELLSSLSGPMDEIILLPARAYAEIRVKCGHIACSLMIPDNLIVRIFIQSACKLLILRNLFFRNIGFFHAFRSEDSSSG